VWLTIIICIGAVALLVGPIMLMQPTGADRHLANLRNHALKQKLRVHMHTVPAGADYKGRAKNLAMYCLPWDNQKDTRSSWLLVRKGFEHDLHAFGNWDWEQQAPAGIDVNLAPHLSSLPDSVIALTSGAQGLCCIWTEKGGKSAVEQLAQWLTATAADISVSNKCVD